MEWAKGGDGKLQEADESEIDHPGNNKDRAPFQRTQSQETAIGITCCALDGCLGSKYIDHAQDTNHSPCHTHHMEGSPQGNVNAVQIMPVVIQWRGYQRL